jgi:2,4-dienoyl-CoA reductase-like NADH-dependent reductase (Old Yellow Enzyme family)
MEKINLSPFSAFRTLFSPFRCRALELRNRVVMAPMTRECAPGGIPTRENADYYARRAAGGTALIITEGTPPDAAGAFGASVPRFFGAEALAGWGEVVAAVHAAGAAIFAQLWHVGAFDPSLIGMRDSLDPPPVRLGPSGLAGPGRPCGRAMTTADIEATIAAYGRAVAAARRLGFDGVEIHGAHGYLPDQFLWSGTNRRQDGYGGDLEHRVRFPVELVRECRRQAGEDLVLSFRLSQWKQLDYAARIADVPDELARIVGPLADAGVDLFHCSTRRYGEPAFPGSELGLAGWVRRLCGRPTIAVGSITLGNDFKSAQGKQRAATDPGQLADIERRLEAGEFDLVALGRALLANPDWVRLVQAGRAAELQPFTRAQLDVLD